MLANRSIPRSTVIPELAYPDLGKVVTGCAAPSASLLRLRIANHRAQWNVDDGVVVPSNRRQRMASVWKMRIVTASVPRRAGLDYGFHRLIIPTARGNIASKTLPHIAGPFLNPSRM